MLIFPPPRNSNALLFVFVLVNDVFCCTPPIDWNDWQIITDYHHLIWFICNAPFECLVWSTRCGGGSPIFIYGGFLIVWSGGCHFDLRNIYCGAHRITVIQSPHFHPTHPIPLIAFLPLYMKAFKNCDTAKSIIFMSWFVLVRNLIEWKIKKRSRISSAVEFSCES